ncbi:MAG: IS1380 family transposase [Cyanobacteria bacterium SZAS LIN-3]|nr:IS1380 family transposase [Cyanobacteria bacterium SZAS LIN-3]
MKKSTTNQRVTQLTVDLLPEKAVELAFDGDDVSGNGGVLLAAQVEKLTGLLNGAAARLDDHRTGSLIKHNMFEQVAQRVYQIIAGLAAVSDSNFLRSDPAIKAAVGRNPISGEDLASQPTQCRVENARSFKELYRLSQWLVEYYIACHRKAPKKLILDFDGSAVETFGVQLNAFYRGGPYKKFMYFPLFVFDEKGWLLVAALRPGDQGEVQLALPVLKRLVKMLRKAWPKVDIVVRADGAFTKNELYQWMDENRISYVMGVKHNNSLLAKTKYFRAKVKSKFERKYDQAEFLGKSGKTKKLTKVKEIRGTVNREERLSKNAAFEERRARVYGEFMYQAGSWDRERKVIARCDYTDEGLEVRYVVTNIIGLATGDIYEKIYCKRALCEMWIKNIKETRCDRLSCGQFKANAFRLLLHALAYTLMHQVQLRLGEKTSIAQFQRNFIHVAVHVSEDRHLVRFRIARSYHAAKMFRLCSKRLAAGNLVAA